MWHNGTRIINEFLIQSRLNRTIKNRAQFKYFLLENLRLEKSGKIKWGAPISPLSTRALPNRILQPSLIIWGKPVTFIPRLPGASWRAFNHKKIPLLNFHAAYYVKKTADNSLTKTFTCSHESLFRISDMIHGSIGTENLLSMAVKPR